MPNDFNLLIRQRNFTLGIPEQVGAVRKLEIVVSDKSFSQHQLDVWRGNLNEEMLRRREAVQAQLENPAEIQTTDRVEARTIDRVEIPTTVNRAEIQTTVNPAEAQPVVDCHVSNCLDSIARTPKRPALRNLTNITGFTSTKRRLSYSKPMSCGATPAKPKCARDGNDSRQVTPLEENASRQGDLYHPS